MAPARDQTPPHDDELERAALGSILFDAEAADSALRNHLKPGDFYSRAHQRIFEAVKSLDEKGLRSDIQTVIQELKQGGKLDEAGGAAYISSLTSVIPSSANIEYYTQSVLDHSLRRALLRVAGEIGVAAFDESKTSSAVLDEVQQRIFELHDTRQSFSFSQIREVLIQTIDKIDEAYKTKNALTGISSGFAELDDMTSGFQPSDFIIIGARPSVGKTALALNIAATIAFRHHKPVAFFSLEMSAVALMQRLISTEAHVDGKKLRSGFISPDDFRRILDVSGTMSEAPFYIVDRPNMEIGQIRSHARRLRAQQNVEIIFIDYLGLIGSDGDSLSIPLHVKIGAISRSLKSLARELEIPVVVLCQVNRETERVGQGGQPPTLANIRDSGSIEQDADLVMFLHKKHPKKGEEAPQNPGDGFPTELIIAKQRNGPIGVLNLEFRPKFAEFVSVEKERSEK